MAARRALIVGLAGLDLSTDEAAFLRRVRPCGIIIFTRNVADRMQLSRLISDVRDAAGGDDLLVLVDQEGGRVRRLRPPGWRDLPAAARYAELYFQDPGAALTAARSTACLLAHELREVGINANCAPCADLLFPGADAIIGDRAYGTEPVGVAALAQAVADGHLAGGVLPIIKHIPGHGRAAVDSHLALPVVEAALESLEQADFAVFEQLRGVPAAMTAHIVYSAIDPDRAASISPAIIKDIIRDKIRFEGLLMCDDLSMGALSGSIGERSAAVLAAGCDVVLHCNGVLAEMEAVAAEVGPLAGPALARYKACIAAIAPPPPTLGAAEAAQAADWLVQLGAAPFPIESV